MSRKKKKKHLKTEAEQATANVSQGRVEAPERSVGDKPFDFGGLPDRDLKKNLGGCG